MNGVMRYVARGLLAAAALTSVWLVTPDKAQADSAGCTAVNGFSTSFALFDPVSVNTPSGTFAAGDTVTITLTLGAGFNPPFATEFGIIPPGGGAPLTISGTQNTTTVLVYTVPAAATGTFQINSSGPAFHAGSLSFMCGSTGSRSSAAQQNATNAQVATANGQQVLQQTNDAIKLGVLSSFAAGNISQTAQASLATYARVAKLENERADLERELADRPVAPNDPERHALEERLALTNRNLDLARDGMQSRTMSVAAAPADGSTSDERKAAGRGGSFHVNGAALADFCGAECGPTDPSTTRWNGWFDGRLVGATDLIAQQSSLRLRRRGRRRLQGHALAGARPHRRHRGVQHQDRHGRRQRLRERRLGRALCRRAPRSQRLLLGVRRRHVAQLQHRAAAGDVRRVRRLALHDRRLADRRLALRARGACSRRSTSPTARNCRTASPIRRARWCRARSCSTAGCAAAPRSAIASTSPTGRSSPSCWRAAI